MNQVVAWNFGGGVNSTGGLVESWRRGFRPDIIVFADTGNEMPYTYEHIEEMQVWLKAVGFPPIEITRWIRKRDSRTNPDTRPAGSFVTIEEQCLTANPPELPSKAYGGSGCTTKWKQQPADEFVANHPLARDVLARGGQVVRCIGYDADEPQRFTRMQEKQRELLGSKNPSDVRKASRWIWKAPLVEWGLGRDECVEAIETVGHHIVDVRDGTVRDMPPLKVPRKSACFFCPSSKKKDILFLRDNYPDLLERALKIEDAARPHLESVKGLGRTSFAWRDYLASEEARVGAEAAKACGLPIVPDVVGDTSCGCYDDSEG